MPSPQCPVMVFGWVADHFNIHLQGGVAWGEGRGRISNHSGAEHPGYGCLVSWSVNRGSG